MSQSIFRGVLRYISRPLDRSSDEYAKEIKEEIAFHISQSARDLEAQGMDSGAAHAVALERFGDLKKHAVECHRMATSGLGWIHRAHLSLTVAMLVIVCVLVLQQLRHQLSPVTSLPASIASMLDNDWSGEVYGSVSTETGVPIEGASLLITVKTWPDGSYFQRAYCAITDSKGRFSLRGVCPTNEYYEVQVAAIAANREMCSSYQEFEAGRSESIDFQLTESAGLTLAIEDSHGTPLSNVRVLPSERVDKSGRKHSVYFDSGQVIVKTTDSDGRVSLPYFKAGDLVTVLIETRDGWESHETPVPGSDGVASIRAVSFSEAN